MAGTQALASLLAAQCTPSDCLLLNGDLGAGKTSFARGFIQALAGNEEVVSPTFTIAQQYRARDNTPIWHFDLYRLKQPGDLRETGLEDALQSGITLIEWPELAADFLPPHALHIDIAFSETPDGRVFSFHSTQESWRQRLALIEKQFYR